MPDTEDFCPTVDGLEDVTVEPVLEPPLSVGVLFRRPRRLASAQGVLLVKYVDWIPKFGLWTAPCRVGDVELVTFGSFAWDAGPYCEVCWATKGGKDRSGVFPDLLILGCSCLEGEAVTMLVGPRRGFRLGSTGTRGAASETGPCWLGCSACEELSNFLPLESAKTRRDADPGNVGTRLGTEFVPASINLDRFPLESGLYAVSSVLCDERCGFRCGMAGGFSTGKSVVSSLLLNCCVRMDPLKSCNGILLVL